MKHCGDITKLSGWDLPVVDCITGGSPCQDLSVAGLRAGLNGKRSGLFMEQIRIVKEMRERDRSTGRTGVMVRPRYMVWENVPGAFSSNGGRDFQAVLTEIARIAEPDAPDVPMPDKRKWPHSGCIYPQMGGWSIAWRLHDAQFWGVPQRRKRIALVADFGGLSAPEILFERQGMSGDSEQSGEERKRAADGAESGTYPAIARSLTRRMDGSPCIDRGPPIICAGFKHKASGETRGIGYEEEKAPSLIAGQESAVYDARGNGDGQTAPTLTGDHQNRVTDYTAICITGEITPTLVASAYKGPGNTQDGMVIAHTLKGKANCDFLEDSETYPITNGKVRRLTPLECERRLQGYPDSWTNIGDWIDSKGKKHKIADSPRYKALGNSIALPFWFWLLRRISAQYERPATLGSLFDGIGGFPLCWERCNGPGTALWASEIEEFPIAVTKKHFPEETT